MNKSLSLIVLILVFTAGMVWAETAEDKDAKDRAKESGEWIVKGNNNFQTKNYDQAITCYKEALAIEPRAANAHYNLGLAYREKRMLDEAIKEFEKAVEINPDSVERHYNLGISYYQKGMIDQAITELDKAAAIKPDDANIHYNLGVAYTKKGMTYEAISSYNEAIAAKPDYADAYYNLGTIYSSKGSKALASDYIYRAGLIYLAQDKKDKALNTLDGLKALNAKEKEKALYEKLNPDLKHKKSEPSK